MSSTSKTRLQSVLGVHDLMFANAHINDRPELVKELREYLSRQNSAAMTTTPLWQPRQSTPDHETDS